MKTVDLIGIASSNQFTGFESTRITDLLTVLAFVSIIIWTVVLVSIIVRQVAVIFMRLTRYIHKREMSILHLNGRRHGH